VRNTTQGSNACRRLQGFIAVAAIVLVHSAMAAYPERPIRLIVPSSAGSGPDLVGRIYANRLGIVLGQQIVVDNRAGANSIIGTETVARAAPDGYTLLITSGSHTTNPHVYKKLPYDALRDFTPISRIVHSSGLVLVVHPAFPAKSVEQLIEMARAAPGKYAYASAGVGNLQHLAGAMFCQMANVSVTHVPYKGGGAAINDVLANQIAMNFASSPAAVPFVKSNRLRGLAFTGLKRSEHLPDVPTLDETGLKGYEVSGWYGVYGPRGLPKAIVQRLYEASRDAVHNPDTKKQYADINIESIGSTPAEFAAYLKADLVKYAKIMKAAGIEPQ
jgi:tripartite-type tricarboxylate transporter receptor subunit TctC